MRATLCLAILLLSGCAAPSPLANTCWPVWQAAWEDPGAWNATQAQPSWTTLRAASNLEGGLGSLAGHLRVLHGRWDLGNTTLFVSAGRDPTATVRWRSDGEDPEARIRRAIAQATPAGPDFTHLRPPELPANGTMLSWHGPLRGNATFSVQGLALPPAWRPDRAEHNADQWTGAYVAQGEGASLWMASSRAHHPSGVAVDPFGRVAAPLQREEAPSRDAAVQRARELAAAAGLAPPPTLDLLASSHCT